MLVNYYKSIKKISTGFVLAFLFATVSLQAQMPVATFVIQNNEVEFCAGDTVRFVNQSQNFTLLLWSFGDGYETFIEQPVHVYETNREITVRLVAFNQNGSDTAEMKITLHEKPVINAIPELKDTSIVFGENISYSISGDYSSLRWSSGESSPEFVVTTNGTYSLTALNNYGCRYFQSFKVKVVTDSEEELEEIVALNNILTPNNDGFNDFLMFKNIDLYEFPVEISIFNALGQVVYTSSNYLNNWNGDEHYFGTFYYVAKSKNRKNATGFVDLIK